MIQIYVPENTNFEMNGNDVLAPSTCTMEAELGGTWILNMTHPIDYEGKWKNIVKEAVISAPTFMGKKQLFRIEESDKQDTEIIVKAYPIFFDSADEVFLMDKRPAGKNGQEALDILTEGTKYRGESNITDVNTAYFIRRNLMNALNGDSPSFIGTWGGEPLYDNFKVIINERAGGDYGAEVRYGKNMDGISFREDMSEVVTRIVPVAFNGHTLSTNYVDSPLISKYAKVYTREIVFEDVKYCEDITTSEDTSNLIVCNSQEELDAALIAKCNEQFEAGIDIYKVTIDVDMVSLENTEEYKNFTDLVRIGLGDTVGCYNNRLGITTKARAIKIKWDCITDSVIEVVLGDYEYNILDQWNSTISKIENIVNNDGTVAAEKIQGILNAINVQLHYQNSAAQKQEVRAILFEDLDPDSPLYGALAIGTQGLQISNKQTADGRDWEWTTAFTANGGYADAIIAGILADKTGKNSWNLETGEFLIEKLKLYSSKEELSSAIQQNADSITSTVSQSQTKWLIDEESLWVDIYGYGTPANDTAPKYKGKHYLDMETGHVYGTITSGEGNIVWTLIGECKQLQADIYSKIQQNAYGISQKVSNGEVVSEINQSADTIELKGDRIIVESTKWKVNENGSQECSDLTITGGEINIDNGSNYEEYNIKIAASSAQYYTKVGATGVMTIMDDIYTEMSPSSFSLGNYYGNSYEEIGYIGREYANLQNTNIIGKTLSISGTKSRIASTKNYRDRLLYCYETPSPMFGDLGEGQIDETGKCYIFLDDIFGETIDTDCVYQVFLQPYGKGECYVTERTSSYFIVEGTECLAFGWELKAIQRDFDTMRLEEYQEKESQETDVLSETYGYLTTLLYNPETEVIENE